MDKTVYVVTSLELGWDCVVGVFEDVNHEELSERFPSPPYVIHDTTVQYNLEGWKDE
jgi:hypothetical protein